MKVLVIGASGAIGRKVVPRLEENGFEVTAMVRKEEDIKRFEIFASNVVVGDILDKKSLESAIKDCEAVINLATAIPNWEQTDKIRNEGTKNLVELSLKYDVRVIQQSIVFLYGDQKDNLVNEETPLQPFSLIQSAFNMEEMIVKSDLNYTILRGGSLYGIGTHMEDGLFELARENKLRLSNNEHAYNSLINVHDYAQACVKAVQSNITRETYNVVDDYPVRDKELYTYINDLFENGETLDGGDRFLPSLKCSNEKIKRDLNWEPAFATYKSAIAIK